MKYIDINRKFTETVSSYIAQGYYINTASMSGSQGEIAHIDLTEWEDYNQLEGLKLVVGIAADNVKPNDNQRCDVIWNNRLDVISCEKFYKLSSNRDDSVFYGTREEANAADEKRFERYCRRDCRIKKHLPEKASTLVKEFVRRKFGLKRVVVSNIQITKQSGVYTVTYNQHSAQLH